MTNAPFLYSGNKDVGEIQQIIIFTKTTNMAKQITDQIVNLAIIIKKRSDGQQQIPKPKTSKEYFNCRKKRYYIKDCYSNLKRKPKDKNVIKKIK